MTGAYGSAPSPSWMQPPIRTTAPFASARSTNDAIRRVLPTPASPATSVALLRPASARARAASSRARSLVRPIRTGLETRDATPSIITLVIQPLATGSTRSDHAGAQATDRGQSRFGGQVPCASSSGDRADVGQAADDVAGEAP